MSLSEHLAAVLAHKGQRLTEHAALVVEAMVSTTGTFTAEDMVARLHETVSRATTTGRLGN
jgi:Fe2+ or Zn2+ uptake regulation protein